MSLAESSPDRSLGRYNLIASLGRGGMANVYLAVSAGLASFNKLLVLKALRPDASPETVQMFLDEARLSACFNHPNIVQTYEVGEASGRYFIALEYLEGQSLRAVQRKLGDAFSMEDELRVLAAIARGLDYAHELRDFEGRPLHVVHRDISPQNVFLTYDGQAKLLDFGIAKATSAEHQTQVGLIKGKVDYIAPEQARGDPVDRRADIFSLGVMAWEAATRQRFSGGPSVSEVTKLHRRLIGAEPDVQEVWPDVPDRLAGLIRCAIAVDPDQRFETATGFADAVESFLESRRLQPSAKTLSDALARPYLEVRARLTAVIEEQLKRFSRDGSRDSSLLILEPGDVTSSLSGVLTSRGDSGLRSRADEPRALPSLSVSTVGMMAPSQPSPPRTWLRQHMAKLAVVTGVVALAAVSALSGSRQLDATKAASPSAAAAGSSAAADRATVAAIAPLPRVEATPAASTVAVKIRVLPKNAQVKLDGATLSELPFRAQLQRDALVHRVEASAPGYVSTTMAVPFDHDRELSVVLQRQAPIAPVRSASTRAATHAPSARERGLESEQAGNGPERAATPAAPAAEDSTPVEPGVPLVTKRRWGLHLDKRDPYEEE